MIRLQLFGRPVLRAPDPVVGPAAQRQRLALLALLATSGDGGMSRDKLIALLWPEADAEHGRHLLSNSVYVLRRALGGDVIRAEGDALRLDPASIRTDVGDFLEALARGDWAAAITRCGAPFLDGFYLPNAAEFERWVETERDRLARACTGALERLAERAEAAGDFRAAVGWWQRRAEADPYSSRAVRGLMQALAAAGEPGEAIHQARLHERRLREDLEAELPAEVAALAAQLGTGPSHPPAGNGSNRRHAPAPGKVPTALPERTSLAPAAAPAPVSRSPWRRAGRRGPVLAGLAVLPLLAIVAALLHRAPPGASAAASSAAPRSIAVLPFANLTPESRDEYFSDGLTEELLNQLAQVDGMRVAARTSAFAFKGVNADVGEIGRRLNVELVLEGSVRRDGERLRVTAQLVNVADGYHLWSRTWEQRALADIFEIQDQIARDIVASVLPRMAGGPHASGGTTNLRAYEAYLRGRYAFWRGGTAEALNAAIAHYQAAIAHDPGYALAYAGLADAYMLLPGPPGERMPSAKRAAERALALDDELSEGYVALASISWFYDRDWAAAERNYRRSFSVNRLIYTRCICYVWYLAAIGDLDGAVREAQRARTFDPIALLPLTTLADVYLAAGRIPELRALLPALRDAGATPAALDWYLAWAEWDDGRFARALAGLERVRRDLAPDSLAATAPALLAGLAFMHAGTGAAPKARALAEALQRRAARAWVPPQLLASAFASAGDTLEAARWIRAAYDERANLAYFALTTAARPLRDARAFQDALRAAGVPGRP